MRIGELSRVTGASTRSLRYYEQKGLITSRRLSNGYRDYDESAVAVVRTITSLLELGLPTAIIEDVLPCTGEAVPSGDCAALMARVTAIRDEMDEKARRLQATSETLSGFLARASLA